MKPTIQRFVGLFLTPLIFGIFLSANAQEQRGTMGTDSLKGWQQLVLRAYAAATWNTFVKLVDPKTGLPADNATLNASGTPYMDPSRLQGPGRHFLARKGCCHISGLCLGITAHGHHG